MFLEEWTVIKDHLWNHHHMHTQKQNHFTDLTISLITEFMSIAEMGTFGQLNHYFAQKILISKKDYKWVSNSSYIFSNYVKRILNSSIHPLTPSALSTLNHAFSCLVSPFGEYDYTHSPFIPLSAVLHFRFDTTLYLPDLPKYISLQTLSLRNCYELTDEKLKGVSFFLPHLHTIDLSECRRITSEGVTSLTALPNLKTLNLKGVHVDKNFKNQLRELKIEVIE